MSINKKWLLLLSVLICQIAMAQKTVTGTVSDEMGPLLGAAVLIKGTTKGTETDFDGKYSIQVKEGQYLEFRYTGMKTKKIKVGSANVYNVKMESEMQQMEEVVITGMVSTDKRLFTGSSTKLKADKMKIEGLPDVSRSLEGRAAGVSVQNVSGTFGAAPKIRVRGATSIYGSSKPLWVVDGVVMEDILDVSSDDLASGDAATLISSAIAGLNPDDIESFDILKDGSATSIYGARAMAGVIVITTKKGKKGSSKISYQGSFTYRDIPSYKNFNIMNSQEEMSVYQELDRKGLFSVASIINARESGIIGSLYKKLYTLNPDGSFEVVNNVEGRNEFLRKAEYRNTDWFRELFEVNALQTHSLSFSSGSEKGTFYGSLSVLTDPGWTKSSNVNRYTGNFNGSFDIYDNLKLNVISNASLRKQKAPGTMNREINQITGKVKRGFDINPYSFALNTSRTLDIKEDYVRNYAPFNILKELNENYIDLNVLNLKFQTELKLKLNSKVDLSALGALKYNTASQKHNITEYSNQANAYRAGVIGVENPTIRDENKLLYTDPDDEYALPQSILPKGGILNKQTNSMFGYDFRTTVTYKDLFNDIHTLNVYAGAEINAFDRNADRNTAYGVQFGLAKTPAYDAKLFKKSIEANNYYYEFGDSRTRNVAFFGNATYSFDRKYTVNGTIRYEGSNRLGKSKTARWMPTWNISGAWNATQEEFFESLQPVLSNFTLKGSYSLTADSGPVSNSLVDLRNVNIWRPTADEKETAIVVRGIENSELTYEKKNELNVGFEAGFIKNRINVTFDWYKRNNYDLIGPVYSQGLGGQIVKFGNVASMKSNGLELSISSTNIKTEDFSWITNFVYSKTNNEITDLESRKRVLDLVSSRGFGMVGYPVRGIFSIPFKGLNEDGLPTFLNYKGETTVYDINLQSRDNIDFLEYSGNVNPTDVGSFGNTFKYKNLSLNIFATYSFGNVLRLDPTFRASYDDFSSLPRELADRWIVPGDEAKTTVPTIPDVRMIRRYGANRIGKAFNIYNYSTDRIAKGDFIRLKEVSLTYDFPKQLLKNLKVSRLSMKVQATNLFLLYSDKKLKGQDPEFLNSGGVATPVPRQLTLTLNLSI